MNHTFISIGAFFALAGVLARSLSSHALLQLLEARGKLANFNLAADYLLVHGLALIGIAVLCKLYPAGNYQRAGWGFILGSLLFQGTVLVKSFVSIKPLGFLTPLGGFVLMLSWALLCFTALQAARNIGD
jgi:uncharacterized membrane protein YgdD (TMEM256/DUF423 family)